MAGRTDSGSRVIKASPEAIYQALVDPAALVRWRPPQGMRGEMLDFEGRPGGRYRMRLVYGDPAQRGKAGDGSDVVEGRFVELVPGERVVEAGAFDSPDPAFAGTMTITTSLVPVPGGTRVTMRCDNVPAGISAEDHQAGIESSLANLAVYVGGQVIGPA